MTKSPDPRKDEDFKKTVKRMLETPPKPFTPPAKPAKKAKKKAPAK